MWSANRCECLTFLLVALNPRKSLNIRSYSHDQEWGFLGQHEVGDTSARSSISGNATRGGLEPQPIHAPGARRTASTAQCARYYGELAKLLGVSRQADHSPGAKRSGRESPRERRYWHRRCLKRTHMRTKLKSTASTVTRLMTIS